MRPYARIALVTPVITVAQVAMVEVCILEERTEIGAGGEGELHLTARSQRLVAYFRIAILLHGSGGRWAMGLLLQLALTLIPSRTGRFGISPLVVDVVGPV